MPHLLELFSGTGSMGRAFRAEGWQVTSVDIREDFQPTILCDVMDFNVRLLEHLPAVDLLWASPPCTEYSCARTRAKTPRDLLGADAMVAKVLDLADQLFCHYLIENPYTGLLKTRQVISQCPHMHVLDYCKYGSPYRKRTAIWTNSPWEPARGLCRYDCAASEGRRHTSRAQRCPATGQRWSLEELYSIPPELCEEVAGWNW
jgi:hypothetical protein